MSFDNTGFTTDSIDDIVLRLSARMKDTFPTINLDPSNLLYQWIKTVALEELYQQNMLENAIANMTVTGASGIFLDRLGAENGIFRKGSQYAMGYLKCTSNTRTAGESKTVPAGTIFSTKDAKNYASVDDAYFNWNIRTSHSAGGGYSFGYAVIPDMYSDFEIGSIYNESGIEITAERYINGQLLIWTSNPALENGETIYIRPDENESYTLSIFISSTIIGAAGNTGENTIIVNTENAAWIDSVTNVVAIDSGSDEETDRDFRYRISESRRRHFTLENIKDMVMGLEGVDDCRVYQNVVADLVYPSDWSEVDAPSDTITMNNGGTGMQIFCITFYPSQYIGTLKGIMLKARCFGNTGNVPDLKVYLAGHSPDGVNIPSDLHHSEFVVDFGDMMKYGKGNWGDLWIPLKYNGFDYSLTYRIYIYSPTADANNYWEFALDNESGFSASWRLEGMQLAELPVYAAAAGNDETNTTIVTSTSISGANDAVDDLKYVVIDGDIYSYSSWATDTITLNSALIRDYDEDVDVILYSEESALENTDDILAFKSYFGTNSYTVTVIPNDNVIFELDLKSTIETMLDYEEGGGYSPVCVQAIVKEATAVDVDVTACVISIEAGFDFDTVITDVKTSITEYLDTLHPGNDIIYSQFEKSILMTNGVLRVRTLTIEVEGESASNTTEYDIPIADDSYPTIGSTLSFTEG